MESSLKGLSDIPILDDILNYNFANIDVEGPNSLARSGEGVHPSTRREDTLLSKANVTIPSGGNNTTHTNTRTPTYTCDSLFML